jgi:hypothetical protein
MFFVAIVDEVPCLRELCTICDSRVWRRSSEDDLYFPAVVIQLARDYTCIEDGFILKIEEGFLKSVAAFLSFWPVAELSEFFFNGFEDCANWFVLVFRITPEPSERYLLEVHPLAIFNLIT